MSIFVVKRVRLLRVEVWELDGWLHRGGYAASLM